MKKFILPVENIPHSKENRLTDSLSEKYDSQIPTNVILDKTVCGIGATYAEITDKKRNSIIIEPNVPVIKDKARKHENDPETEILAIYKGINKPEIKRFLSKETTNKKKILTTPEGFKKLRDVALNPKNDIDIYKEYFCLFDECEKITQDVGYRKRISQPFYDFFEFEEKALVSATPLEIRHPRMKADNFRILKVKPDYDYRENLRLIVTNTFMKDVATELHSLKNSEGVCIFFNSTKGIHDVIQESGITDYKVFCSEDAQEKFLELDITKTEPEFSLPVAKYNFFTSRFYSAFDIELKNIFTDVIMLTDFKSAVHSMIDPWTEAIQIQGRFRDVIKDDKRYKSLTQITNLKDDFTVKTPAEISERIKVFERNYKLLKDELDKTENENTINAIIEDIKQLKYTDLLDEHGNINHFSIDNLYDDERVKSYYVNEKTLLQAFKDKAFFDVEFENRINPYIIEAIEKDYHAAKGISKVEATINIIKSRDSIDELKPNLCKVYKGAEVIIRALEKIGEEVIERYGFELNVIKKKLAKYENEEKRFGEAILGEIYSEFRIGEKIIKADFSKRLKPIYDRFRIMEKPAQSRVADYFEFNSDNNPPYYFTLRGRRIDMEEYKNAQLSLLKLKWVKP